VIVGAGGLALGAGRVAAQTVAVTSAAAPDSAARFAESARKVAIGDRFLAAGQRDSAGRWYSRAIDHNPDDVDATVKLATLLVEDGHGARAQHLLTDALRRHPDDPRLLHFHAYRIGADTTGASHFGP
jgi:predicted Zn-dependent protease